MSEQIVAHVKSWMNSQSFLVNDSWLRECIEYFCSQNHSQVNVNNVQKFVLEQYLLSDLRETNNINGCLPPNISEKTKITLNKKYTLQLLKLYDISMPKYKQLEKIRNVSTVNIEATNENNPQAWEPTGKRMLQLFLTDGIQEILAIEYRPIRILNDMLLPGLKLLIMGPVICRKGVIFLEETNIAIKGGEVSDLLIPNAMENVLANALNMPINEDPYNDKNKKEAATTVPNDFEDEFNVDEIEQLAQPEREKNINPPNLSSVNKCSSTKTDNNAARNQNPMPPPPKNQFINDFLDDMIFDIKFEEEFLFNNDENSSKEPSTNSNSSEPKPSTSNLNHMEFLDDDFDLNDADFNSGVTWSEPVEPVKNDDSENSEKTTGNFQKQSDSGDSVLPEVVTGNKRSSAQLSPIESTPKILRQQNEPPKSAASSRKITDFLGNKAAKQEECPPKVCDYISEILTLSLSERPILRSVRAKVKAVGKLSKKDMQWILDGEIEDLSGVLEVNFSSQFMDNLLGLSVAEFSNWKKKMKNDPQSQEALKKKMQDGQEKLTKLHGLMELEWKKGSKPVVLSCSELNESQRIAHNKRFKFLESKNKK